MGTRNCRAAVGVDRVKNSNYLPGQPNETTFPLTGLEREAFLGAFLSDRLILTIDKEEIDPKSVPICFGIASMSINEQFHSVALNYLPHHVEDQVN